MQQNLSIKVRTPQPIVHITVANHSFNPKSVHGPSNLTPLLRWPICCWIYDHVICKRVGVYCHFLYHRRFDRLVLVSLLGCLPSEHRKPFHLIQHLPSIQNTTKHGMQIVQMGLALVQQEKLGSIGIRTFVGHAQHATLQFGEQNNCEQIFKRMLVAISIRITSRISFQNQSKPTLTLS